MTPLVDSKKNRTSEMLSNRITLILVGLAALLAAGWYATRGGGAGETRSALEVRDDPRPVVVERVDELPTRGERTAVEAPAPQAPITPGLGFRVSVVDDLGAPVEGAEVHRLRESDEDLAMAETDADGVVVFEGLSESSYRVFLRGADSQRASRPSACADAFETPSGLFVPEWSRSVTATPTSDLLTIELLCVRPGFFSGRSFWATDGAPGGEVIAWDTERHRSYRADVEALDGSFCMVLPTGSYLARALPNDARERRSPVTFARLFEFRISSGQTVVHDFRAAKEGVFITGELLDQEGAPWKNALVTAYDPDPRVGQFGSGSAYTSALAVTRTNEKGEFRIGPLPRIAVSIAFEADGHPIAEPGGFGEYPLPLELDLSAEQGDVIAGPWLAYRWQPLTVKVRKTGDGAACRDRAPLEIEIPAMNPGGAPIRREARPGLEGWYEFNVSAHRAAELRIKHRCRPGGTWKSIPISPASSDPLLVSACF